MIINNYEKKDIINGETSDGFHTFDELYKFRMIFNALLVNEWASKWLYDIHKSWNHFDWEKCFGGWWFIVTMELPTGQVSFHYEDKYFDLFKCEYRKIPNKWDWHTSLEALERLEKFLNDII